VKEEWNNLDDEKIPAFSLKDDLGKRRPLKALKKQQVHQQIDALKTPTTPFFGLTINEQTTSTPKGLFTCKIIKNNNNNNIILYNGIVITILLRLRCFQILF